MSLLEKEVMAKEARIAELEDENDSIRHQCERSNASYIDAINSNDELRKELAEAKKERDLAIAHDRQAYPTADAYERVCATLEKTKKQLAEARAALQRYVDKFGNCGAVYVQAMEVLGE